VNILLIHQYFMKSMQVGGGSRWNEMTKVWAEQGHKITVIAGMYCLSLGKKNPEYEGKLFKQESVQEGLRVIRVHTSSKYNKNYLWRSWAYISFILFGLVGSLLFARRSFDVVIASSPPLTVGPLGVVISWFKRCPFIFEVRDLWPESAIDTGVLTNKWLIKLMYFMEKISYKKSSAINVLTPAFRKSISERKKISPDKIWMIPNAADLELVKPGPMQNEIRKRHNWDDKFVGLYIGAHGKANYLWQLIQTAELLRNDPEYLIVCVGNGMERDALIQKAKQDNLTNIQFLPSVAKRDVYKYLNACNVSLIVLKKVESFKTVYPNKMFDSMAAARPVILAIDGVARKLIEDGKAGIYVEPENAEEIANAMKFYRSSPETAMQHGQNGYEFAKQNYDRRNLAAKYIKLIEEKVIRNPNK